MSGEKVCRQIVPDNEEQEWSEKNKYAGIFNFKFWRCGQWMDVVIDDYLPTRQGRLIFVHSNTRNEFWSALLEKAYAKLAGDYESLVAGNAKDALVDMTGGVGERVAMEDYATPEKQKDLFRILKHSKENHSLMSASIVTLKHKDCGPGGSASIVKKQRTMLELVYVMLKAETIPINIRYKAKEYKKEVIEVGSWLATGI